jgi:hypothetical protein
MSQRNVIHRLAISTRFVVEQLRAFNLPTERQRERERERERQRERERENREQRKKDKRRTQTTYQRVREREFERVQERVRESTRRETGAYRANHMDRNRIAYLKPATFPIANRTTLLSQIIAQRFRPQCHLHAVFCPAMHSAVHSLCCVLYGMVFFLRELYRNSRVTNTLNV